jgi:hypothetical protein
MLNQLRRGNPIAFKGQIAGLLLFIVALDQLPISSFNSIITRDVINSERPLPGGTLGRTDSLA